MPPTNSDDPLRTTDHEPGPASASPDVTTDHTPASSPTWGSTSPFVPGAITEPECAAGAAAVPGYEIEGVLGRGGMGVVYKARHLALKRSVALKMILAGGHAGPQELARFRIEAEAVARLQHPNIVQVFEVGEAGGHPFCALEFVEGGSLAGKLEGQPLPARDAARLVETLARAVQLAHSRNVVHRDLKPANVLLSTDGTPKITDFGLARQLDSDSGETQAGAIMGTPSYMAPEQASGRAHEAGPAADVYALGAILYDCLAGRPPFKGKTVVETLDQVRNQEPVPPSRWQKSVPLDLETICLKCLRKEPEKRYASAAELADDLGRFLRGEPVLARPVGRLERGWRWCRRSPALASALAAVVAVLVLASVVSTRFGIEAHNEATAAVQARNDLVRKNTELEQQQAEVVRKNTELEQKQDQLEETLARSWLSPLAGRPGPLTDAEVAALEQVAAQPDNWLPLRFVRVAATDQRLTPRLRARAAYALHAAVGLDRGKRAAVERLLLAELRSSASDPLRQEDLAFAAATLGDLSPETEATAAATLLQALSRTSDSEVLLYLAPGLMALTAHMEPRQATVTLLQAMSKTTKLGPVQILAQGLPALAARLSPGEAAEAAATLTQVMRKTSDPLVLGYQARGLSALAARMKPREGVARLTQVMSKTAQGGALRELVQGLSALASRLEPGEAETAVATLLQAMSRTTEPWLLPELAQGLSALASRLGPRGAAETAATLLGDLSKTTQPGRLQSLAQILSALAGRLEPREAARATAALTRAMTRTTDPYPMRMLAPSLSVLAARLEPREAAEAAATLRPLLGKTTDLVALRNLAQAVSALAARLEPKEAAAVCDPAAAALLQALSRAKTTEPDAFRALTHGLSALAARLGPKKAATVCSPAAGTLTRAIGTTTNPYALRILVEALSVLAARLEPGESAALSSQAATLLTQTINRTTDPLALRGLAEGLSALAEQMGPGKAVAVCGPAAATLTRILGQTTNPGARRALAQGISMLAEQVGTREAAGLCRPAAATLARVLNQTTQPGALQVLATGLAGLAAHLEPGEAAALCRPAAATLAQAMRQTTDPNVLWFLAEGLTGLAAHLGPKEAASLCSPAVARVLQVMSRTPNPRTLRTLAQALSVLATRMEPGKAAVMLLRVMGQTDPNVLRDLAQGLSAVLSRSDPTKDRPRSPGVAGTVGGASGPWSLLTASAFLQLALDPLPPLPAQTLVSVLKDPLCVGKHRKLVLEQLARHYGRPFADQWDFVRHAEANRLGLDFTRNMLTQVRHREKEGDR